MSLRDKAKKRQRTLIIGLILLVVLAGGGWLFYDQVYRKKRDLAWRDAGIAAYKAEDYTAAFENLQRFVSRDRNQRDADGLYYYAQTIKKMESYDGRQIKVAATFFRKFLDLQPQRNDVRADLMDAYNQVGMHTEALDVAERLYSTDKKHKEALRTRATANASLRQYKQALAAAEEFERAYPADIDNQLVIIRLYRELNRKGEILPRAEKLMLDHPGDLRYELVMAVAYSMTEELSAAQREHGREVALKLDPKAAFVKAEAAEFAQFFALRAAGAKVVDVDHLKTLVRVLEGMRLVRSSIAVMEKTEVGADLPMVQRGLVHRLWETNRFEEAISRIGKMKLKLTSYSDVEMMGLQAVSFARVGKPAETDAIASKLAENKKDRFSQAWAVILKEFFVKPDADSLAVVQAIRTGLEEQPYNAYLYYYLGEAYNRVGERELAIDSYERSRMLSPLWAFPAVYLSRLQMEAGQIELARVHARDALMLYYTPGILGNFCVMMAAGDDALSMNDTRFRDTVAKLQIDQPNEEQTLAIYVTLLVRNQQRGLAEKVIKDAIALPKPLSVGTLLSLVAASREHKLDLEEAIYAAAEKAYPSHPDIVASRAGGLILADKKDEAVRFYDQAWKKAAPKDDFVWRMAWARLLDFARDDRAAGVWKEIAADPKYRSNAVVLRAVLMAQALQSDRKFLLETAESLRKVTGDQGMAWRIAKARALMIEGGAEGDLSEAAKLLKEVVSAAPNDFEARVILGRLLLRQGNVPAVIEQWNVATRLRPRNIPLALELAFVFHSQQDYPRAREVIERFPISKFNGPQKRQVASIYAQQGDLAKAGEIMQSIATESATSADRLIQAELFRRSNQFVRAEAIFAELLKGPPERSVLLSAADFYASRGKKDEARKIIARLDELKLPPLMLSNIMGEFESRHGDPKEAVRHFRAAAKSKPDDPMLWRVLVSQLLRNGSADEALAAAGEGVKACAGKPGVKPLETLVKESELVKAFSSPQSPFHSLVLVILHAPSESDNAIEAMRIVDRALKQKQSIPTVLTLLRPVANRAARVVSLQAIVVQLDLELSSHPDPAIALPALAEASAIALRTMKTAPNSSDMARLASEALYKQGDLIQALTTATKWRELTDAQPVPADFMLAKIHFKRGELAQAARQIEPHIPMALADAELNYSLLELHSQCAVLTGQAKAVGDRLFPLLAKSHRWRAVWISLAVAIPDNSAESASWLTRIEGLIPAANLPERISLINAWYQLGINAKLPAHKARAVVMADELVKTNSKTPGAYFARGGIYTNEGRLADAERDYRDAIKLNPDYFLAINNLAMLLADKESSLNEAFKLANDAIASLAKIQHEPSDGATLYDTLAYVKIKQKDTAGAITALEKARDLEPGRFEWHFNLAKLYEREKKDSELRKELDVMDALVPDKSQVPADTRAALARMRTRASGKVSGQ